MQLPTYPYPRSSWSLTQYSWLSHLFLLILLNSFRLISSSENLLIYVSHFSLEIFKKEPRLPWRNFFLELLCHMLVGLQAYFFEFPWNDNSFSRRYALSELSAERRWFFQTLLSLSHHVKLVNLGLVIIILLFISWTLLLGVAVIFKPRNVMLLLFHFVIVQNPSYVTLKTHFFIKKSNNFYDFSSSFWHFGKNVNSIFASSSFSPRFFRRHHSCLTFC